MINETLDAVRDLYASKSYDAALIELDGYEKEHELTAEMLLLKGRLIQLSESGARPLVEAKQSFLSALRQDRDNVSALVELGWLCTNVLDEHEAGRRYFLEALKKCDVFRDEATRGLKSSEE